MFLRIVELKSTRGVPASKDVSWALAKTDPLYTDFIVEADKFVDDPAYVYVASLDGGDYTVLKDTGAVTGMPHTYAGWPFKELTDAAFKLAIVVAPDAVPAQAAPAVKG